MKVGDPVFEDLFPMRIRFLGFQALDVLEPVIAIFSVDNFFWAFYEPLAIRPYPTDATLIDSVPSSANVVYYPACTIPISLTLGAYWNVRHVLYPTSDPVKWDYSNFEKERLQKQKDKWMTFFKDMVIHEWIMRLGTRPIPGFLRET